MIDVDDVMMRSRLRYREEFVCSNCRYNWSPKVVQPTGSQYVRGRRLFDARRLAQTNKSPKIFGSFVDWVRLDLELCDLRPCILL